MNHETSFHRVRRGLHPDGQQKPTPAEKALLDWFRAEMPKRLNDPDRIVTESAALEFFEVEKKAAALKCGPDWENPNTARDRWAAIGGYVIGKKLIRAYRKEKGLPLNPPT